MGFRCQLKPKTPSGAARFNYIKREGKYARDKADLVHSADHNMPDFAKTDARLFWEAADEYERSNARICLEFELNLPTELNLKQQIECVEKFINSLDTKAGKFPTSYAIHNDKDGQNPHVHLMISERTLDGIDRPAELFFKRANSKKPELGGNKKSLFFNRSSENVLWTRASWAESCNETLIEHGFDARFDSRTKAAQRLEAIEVGDIRKAVRLSTLTETHEGPHVGGIRKRLEAGQLSPGEVDAEILEKLDSNDTIKDFNRELKLFAAVADIEQLQAFLECEKPAERMAFIADLYTPKPTPAAELDYETEDLEHDYTRESQRNTNKRASSAGGVQQHIEYLHVVQSRKNNQILQDTISRSELCKSEGRAGSVLDKRDTVRTAVQQIGGASSAELRNVRRAELEVKKVLSPEDFEKLEAELTRAQRDAEHAELSLDIAKCAFSELRKQLNQLNDAVADSKPRGLKSLLVTIGLANDASIELQSELKKLRAHMRVENDFGIELQRSSIELRAHADKLLERVETHRLQQPKPKPEPEQDAPQAQQSAFDSFFESRGFAASIEQPAQQQEVKRPSRGPRMG